MNSFYFSDVRDQDQMIKVVLYRYSFVYDGNYFSVLADSYEVLEDYVYFYFQDLIVAMYPILVVNALNCDCKEGMMNERKKK